MLTLLANETGERQRSGPRRDFLLFFGGGSGGVAEVKDPPPPPLFVAHQCLQSLAVALLWTEHGASSEVSSLLFIIIKR